MRKSFVAVVLVGFFISFYTSESFAENSPFQSTLIYKGVCTHAVAYGTDITPKCQPILVILYKDNQNAYFNITQEDRSVLGLTVTVKTEGKNTHYTPAVVKVGESAPVWASGDCVLDSAKATLHCNFSDASNNQWLFDYEQLVLLSRD